MGRNAERDSGEIDFSPGLCDPTETWRWDSMSYDQYSYDSEVEVVACDELRPVHTTTTTTIHPLTNRPITHRVITNRPITQEARPMDTIYNPASDTTDDRFVNEEYHYASAIVERYVTSTGAIYHEVGFDGLVADACEKLRLDPTDDADRVSAITAVQHVLKERCVTRHLRVDEVYLDLDDVEPNERKRWLTTIPKIVFTQITAADTSLRAATGDKRWIAVYFDAESAPTTYREDKYNPGEWVSYPDAYSPAGYMGIVATFDGLPACQEAAAELRRAITTIARWKAGTALEPDPVTDTLSEHRNVYPNSL